MFKHALTETHAIRIAELLNKHNKLRHKYTRLDILNSDCEYYPIYLLDTVFGSIGVERINFMLTEIKHLVVPAEYRGQGFGKALVKTALAQVRTPLVFATIREDNTASRALFESFGFKQVCNVDNDGHKVCFVLRHSGHKKTNSLSQALQAAFSK